jgi:hypothetical protein
MSSPDTPVPAPRQSPVMKIAAAVAAVAVLAFGASAVARHGSSSAASPGGQTPPQGFAPPQGGSGAFAPVTGATLAKLKSAVAAQYPGTVERAVKLPGGAYEVHVIRSSGQEVHVLVSREFTVTGTERRDFRGGPPSRPSA